MISLFPSIAPPYQAEVSCMNKSAVACAQSSRIPAAAQFVWRCRAHMWLGLIACLGLVHLAHAEPVSTMTAERLANEIAAEHPPLILDVRSEEEFAAGHVPGAINVPHAAVEAEVEQLAAYRDLDVVAYCVAGKRAAIALQVLETHGFHRLWHLDGDYSGWLKQGREVEITETTTHR